jgi:(2Fe-2S) ferredoxin
MKDQAYFQHHVFFCINERNDGRACCADRNAQALQEYAKKRLKTLDMNGPGKIRVNKAGCLDRCEEGPVLVVYPEGIWYTYIDEEDIDEIVDSHLIAGKPVERLKI